MENDLLQRGIAALKAGDKAEARRVLGRIIRQNPRDEQAWLWMSGAVDTAQERSACLTKVLEINPHNEAAQRGLAALQKQLPLSSTSPSPIETQPVPHPKRSLVQAVLGTGPPAAEQISTRTSTEATTAAHPCAPTPDRLNQTKTFDQLTPEEQKALEGYTHLIAHELINSDVSQNEIVERLTKRGFPQAAVEQHVAKVAKTKRVRGTRKRSIPFWAWLFVLACGAIPVITLGGAIPGAIGFGGAAGCLVISRDVSKSTLVRIMLCSGITIASWVLFLIVMGAISAF